MNARFQNVKTTTSVFMVSSSLPVVFITMFYLGYAFNSKNRPSRIPYEFFSIGVPFLYGIFGVANYYATLMYGTNMSIAIGGLFGLLLSVIGRFYLNLPKQLFNFTSKNEHMVHIYAVAIYAGIFRCIVTPVTQYIIS